jgi:aminoglycoside phosphotransferase (APT) family kinase protein
MEPNDDAPPGGPGQPDDVVGPVSGWLSDCLDQAVDPEAIEIDRPSSGGWSNETWLIGTGLDDPSRVVVRLRPDRSSMFPTYDLGRQVACLQTLALDDDIPVPRVLGFDPLGDRLGRPAFVMEHVAGRIPRDDRPTFAEAGFLREASTAEQRQFLTSFLDVLVAVHRTDITHPTLDPLRPTPGDHSNAAAIEGLRHLWAWDRGRRWPTEIDTALERLGGDMPEPTEEVLLWGDARPANVIVSPTDFTPVALLDWELATIGSPEHDLTWFLEMNHMRIAGAGLPPLPGFLDDGETTAHYQRSAGRELEGLDWYRLFAATKVAVLMHRYLRAAVHAKRLPEDHKLFSGTVASRRLADLGT